MMNHIIQTTYQRTEHKTPWNYLSANLVAFPCNIQKGLHNQASHCKKRSSWQIMEQHSKYIWITDNYISVLTLRILMTEPTLPQNCHPVQNSFPRFHLSMKGSTGGVIQIVILWHRLKQPHYLNMVFGQSTQHKPKVIV